MCVYVYMYVCICVYIYVYILTFFKRTGSKLNAPRKKGININVFKKYKIRKLKGLLIYFNILH